MLTTGAGGRGEGRGGRGGEGGWAGGPVHAVAVLTRKIEEDEGQGVCHGCLGL